MTPAEARTRFFEVQREQAARRQALCAAEEQINAEGKAATIAAAVAKGLRKPHSYERAFKKLSPEEFEALAEPFRVRSRQQTREFLEHEKRLRDEAFDVAQRCVVEPGPHEAVLHESSVGHFNNQGWGAEDYARKYALLKLDGAAALGLQGEVRLKDPNAPGYARVYVAVVLLAHPEDVEIVKLRPLSLRDTLKKCWQRGANPRVIYPGLPHGLEEQFGIDYWGRDLPQPQGAAP